MLRHNVTYDNDSGLERDIPYVAFLRTCLDLPQDNACVVIQKNSRPWWLVLANQFRAYLHTYCENVRTQQLAQTAEPQ